MRESCYVFEHAKVRRHLRQVPRRLSTDRITVETGRERRVSLLELQPFAGSLWWLTRGGVASHGSAQANTVCPPIPAMKVWPRLRRASCRPRRARLGSSG